MLRNPGASTNLVNLVIFHKADGASVVFTKTGAGTVSLKGGTYVEVAGVIIPFASDTAVTMPSLTAGTDYAIYVCSDGSVRADASFSAPSGYTTANSRKIGGFHYAPGGNAAAQAGGDTTPAINPYSMWDLKWRPSCPDPRGMTLVAEWFWADIYLLGVDHHANGTSRNNVTIADGSSPPKIPAMFGGDGSTAYGQLNWWDAAEVMSSWGKGLMTYDEFAAAAYGVSEQVSRGNDPITTGLGTTNAGSSNADEKFTSKWGLIQAAGVLWVWGNEFAAGYDGGWQGTGASRGNAYDRPHAALFGALWDPGGGNAGSRASNWSGAPTGSAADIGARGRGDHLVLV